MKYFIETASCLSFTEAAERLYISQPSLSKHICSMEDELNFQLFIRCKNRVHLTPAGEVLLDGLKKMYSDYKDLVDRALLICESASDTINIGILEEILIPDTVQKVLAMFADLNQHINMNLTNFSFRTLTDGLYNGSLDLILTLSVDIDEKSGIEYKVLESLPMYLIVQSKHKIAALNKIDLNDFSILLKDENFIIVSPEDSKASANGVFNAFKRANFTPKYKYAQSAGQLSLRVAAGQGVAIVNKRHTFINNPDISFIPISGIEKSEIALAWTNPVIKPTVSLFLERITDIISPYGTNTDHL